MSEARVLLEVISEGPHCVPCEIMIGAVREVAPQFGERLEWRVINLREREGVERYRELREGLEEKPPVPSIVINGRLAFAAMQGPDELIEAIEKALTD